MEQKPEQIAHVNGSPVRSLSRSMLVAWALVIAILAGGIGFTAGMKTGKRGSQPATTQQSHPLVTPPWTQSQAVATPLPQSQVITPQWSQPQEILVPTQPEQSIKDLIQVQVPQGWTEKIDQLDYQELEIISPDIVTIYANQKTNAVGISFKAVPTNDPDALENRYQIWYNQLHGLQSCPGCDHDLIKTTLAGLPAISIYHDFEGHSHEYNVVHGGFLWYISIGSPSKQDETDHQASINAVLSSIKFLK